MHELIHDRWKPIGAAWLVALMCSWSYADGPTGKSAAKHDPFLSIDSWQDPVALPARVQPAQALDVNSVPSVPSGGIISANPAPEATFPVPEVPPNTFSTDGAHMLSPDGYCDPNGDIHLSDGDVRLRDGGSPDDWSWGCGGSPYRTGPGFCDNWKVGCRWETYVDGMFLFRDNANLGAIQSVTQPFTTGGPIAPDVVDQFDEAVGGRVSLTGYMPRWSNYNVQAAFEGVEAWNASIVYPQISPTADSFEQRSVFYRSNLYSGELNIVRLCHPVWRPYCGVRYIKFDDEIRHFIDQEALPPLPAPVPVPVTEIDSLNNFDIENDLIGIHAGVRRDIWRLGRMFSVQGFANAGIFHNRIKRTHITAVDTLVMNANDTDTPANETSEVGNTLFNQSVSELSDLSYTAEASVTAICRLNRCCALRTGCQVLWINNVQVAEDDFLDDLLNQGGFARSLFFYGWHAGFEYRR